MENIPVITLDGPGGSGKGTISRILARHLHWHFLDSGALYRLVGLAAGRQGIALDDEAALSRLAENLDANFVATDSDDTRILLENTDVTDELRSESAGAAASSVAVLPGVRLALVERQRAFLRSPGLVADGRDMGTVIFPRANLKIYLDASAEERARRRYNQLRDKGLRDGGRDVSLVRLLAAIEERDRRDRERATAPLMPAADAITIDTTRMTITTVVDAILQAWRTQGSAGTP